MLFILPCVVPMEWQGMWLLKCPAEEDIGKDHMYIFLFRDNYGDAKACNARGYEKRGLVKKLSSKGLYYNVYLIQ